MRYHSFLRSPKKEEQQVPESTNTSGEEFSDTKLDDAYTNGDNEIDIMDDLEHIWGIEEEENDDGKFPGDSMYNINIAGHELNWDFMDWDELPNGDEEGEEELEQKVFERKDNSKCFFEEESYYKRKVGVKHESVGFWDEDDEKKMKKKKVQLNLNLNLNLNYQEVLDAWSDRGPLWADDGSPSSMASNGNYMGEVPVMDEDRTRREARVQRYKDKRQSRLFSKKIRYQVRKLNADKRPRLKGRFVKRT